MLWTEAIGLKSFTIMPYYCYKGKTNLGICFPISCTIMYTSELFTHQQTIVPHYTKEFKVPVQRNNNNVSGLAGDYICTLFDCQKHFTHHTHARARTCTHSRTHTHARMHSHTQTHTRHTHYTRLLHSFSLVSTLSFS